MGSCGVAQLFPVHSCTLRGWCSELQVFIVVFFFFCPLLLPPLDPVSQGALEEQLTLTGDAAYNAHFGESIANLGDIDDDGFPGEQDRIGSLQVQPLVTL